MNRKRTVYQFMAKTLVIIMIFQGMPLWELSNVYKWEYQPEKLQKILDILSVFGPAEAQADTVTLQNGTATFSQVGYYKENYIPDQATDGIYESGDGIYESSNGWAIFRRSENVTINETAVWETSTDLDAGQLKFKMYFNFRFNDDHLIGRFKLSVTTDDRSEFADGLDFDGDVTANWTVLTNPSISLPSGLTYEILDDDSVLIKAGDTVSVPNAVYEIDYTTSVSGITGIRLDVLKYSSDDYSLPYNGPGFHYKDGNFVLSEFTLETVLEESCEAVIKADPNPGALGSNISFDGSSSLHCDLTRQIVEYLWDFDDSDGVDFDHPDATGPAAEYAYGKLGDYTVTLKILDNGSPQ
ncbi:MAG: hypothetical protein GY749_44260, partial [Desulfobacteraceae bacterium]|nr:hypothetical protein [Desulfobacteraceae bacterium]